MGILPVMPVVQGWSRVSQAPPRGVQLMRKNTGRLARQSGGDDGQAVPVSHEGCPAGSELRPGLLELLAGLSPLDEEIPEIEDYPARQVAISENTPDMTTD